MNIFIPFLDCVSLCYPSVNVVQLGMEVGLYADRRLVLTPRALHFQEDISSALRHNYCPQQRYMWERILEPIS